jgi:hypothetical protein
VRVRLKDIKGSTYLDYSSINARSATADQLRRLPRCRRRRAHNRGRLQPYGHQVLKPYTTPKIIKNPTNPNNPTTYTLHLEPKYLKP